MRAQLARCSDIASMRSRLTPGPCAAGPEAPGSRRGRSSQRLGVGQPQRIWSQCDRLEFERAGTRGAGPWSVDADMLEVALSAIRKSTEKKLPGRMPRERAGS
jgi:hypothetical protein